MVRRPGIAGANTVVDQIQAAASPLAQVSGRSEDRPEGLLRIDLAGAIRDLLDWARDEEVSLSVGFDLTEPVRDAIGRVPAEDWILARNQEGPVRTVK